MTARYRFDPAHSRLTVQAFAGGLLSFVAHSPTFAVQDFTGEMEFDPTNPAAARLEVVVRADSLKLTDNVRPADRAEIETCMRSEVLEISRYPEIRFDADDVAATRQADGRYRLGVSGLLALHGVSNRLRLEAELLVYPDGIRATGAFPLRLSEYHIRPVTALAGSIKLKDELKVTFDIAAWKEDGGQATP